MARRMVLVVVVLLMALSTPNTVRAQTPSSHLFFGNVSINAQPAPDGTLVLAFIEGAIVASTAVSGSRYVLSVVDNGLRSFGGKSISFQAAGEAAAEVATYQAAAVTFLNLSVSTGNAVAVTLASIADALVTVWHFDAASQRWQVFDPRAPGASDLRVLSRGKGYLVVVNRNVSLVTTTFTYQLVNGINMIGWLGN